MKRKKTILSQQGPQNVRFLIRIWLKINENQAPASQGLKTIGCLKLHSSIHVWQIFDGHCLLRIQRSYVWLRRELWDDLGASGSLWEDLEPSGTSEPGSFWEPPGASGRLWEPLGTGKMRATETSSRNTILTMFTWGIYLDQLLSCWQLFDSSTVPSQLKHGITFAGWWHYYPSKWFTIRITSNNFITFACRMPWNLQAAGCSRLDQTRKWRPKQSNLDLQQLQSIQEETN